MNMKGKVVPLGDDEYGVVVHVIEKSRREQIRISLNEHRGYDYIDLRVFYNSGDGWRPSRKGLTMKKESFPELFRGIVELGSAIGMEEEVLLQELSNSS